MAQFDPRGTLGPHVRRHVEALAAAVDELVVVSTSELTGEARRFLSERARLVERDNTGYDFLSYKTGLDGADLEHYDEVTVTNDSYVALLDPAQVYGAMAGRTADFWGLTETDRVKHHVQSFFITFRRPTMESDRFRTFWSDMEVLDDRAKVIRRYEVGLSRKLYRDGLRSAAYFTENDNDRRIGRRRVRWWALRRTGLPHRPAEVALLRKRAREPWNPSAGLADRALDGARLPYVKLDTLRYDPYGLGADRLLDLCEETHPAAFEGVRGFLADTERFYPPRPREALLPVPAVARPLRRFVEYGRA